MNRGIAGLAAGVAFVLAALPAFAAAPAPAAPDSSPRRCFLLGMAFSQGSVMRVGNTPKVCKSDGTWGASDDQAAGCVYESKLYSTGALRPLPNGGQPLECLSDGTWSPVPAVKKKNP